MIHLVAKTKAAALVELGQWLEEMRGLAVEAGKEFRFEMQKLCQIANGFLAFCDRAEYQEWSADKVYDRRKRKYDFTLPAPEAPKG